MVDIMRIFKGQQHGTIKIHSGRYYGHAQTSNAYNFCLSRNSTKFIRMFMGQYLKGNNMEPIKSITADAMRMRQFLMLIASV